MTSDQGRHWRYPGARWWKFDFHTHTPASQDTYWYNHQDNPLTPEQWLQHFMDADIDCVAITDHNSGAWIDQLKAAYERMRNANTPGFRELYLFPGVEISVNAGFHLLAIFDVDKTMSDIDTLLGHVDYDGDKGDSNSVTRKSAIEVVEAVLHAGGIPIPSHTDDAKGLLRLKDDNSNKPELDANTIRQVLACKGILAMEVVDPSRSKPTLYKEADVTWSEVLGSDCHSFRSQNCPGSRYTWVKMETPSIEGLRLALMDGAGFSIRRNDEEEPVELPKLFVEAVEIKNARFMGRGQPAKLEFSPRLNALVGGRGTGKSTVVHALRLAARLENDLVEELGEQSEPRLTFERFNRVPTDSTDTGGLRDETELTWTVMRDGVRHRVHWTPKGDAVRVEEDVADGDWQPSPIQTVSYERFPIRIYSQGQIAALAGEKQQALLGVIDKAAGVDELKTHLKEAQAAFFASRARIRELAGKLARRDTITVERRDVERKLQRFEEAGHTAILTTYRQRSRQRTEIDRQFNTALEAAERIEATAATLQSEDLPDGLFVTSSNEDREVTTIINTLATAVRTAADGLHTTAQRLREVVDTQREALTEGTWRAAVDQAAGDYDQLVQALHKEGISDLNEYGRLVQERQRLDGELSRLDSMQAERDRLVEVSRANLQNVLEARRAVSDARSTFLEHALAENRFVRIQDRTYGSDRRVVERSLRDVLEVRDARFQGDILVTEDGRLKGAVARLFADLPDDQSARRSTIEARIDRLKRRICNACAGSGDFGGSFNNYFKREFNRKPELLDRVLAWFPEDGLNVEYSRLGDGTDFRPITQASAGQRSAAMLAFLLAHGDEPLVLDQPEDDLDNYLIYDLVVRQIRENKLRRQIIVVTHNPNVVVNGDAEMLHVLDFHGQCFIKQKGSLQEESIREEVCRVMEGGREAFERRYRRLGPEPVHV